MSRGDGGPRGRGRPAFLVLVVVLLLLTGCAGGPAALADGDYRAMAVAAGEVPVADLVIDGDEVTLTAAGVDYAAELGDVAGSMTLCPPDGEGHATRLADGLVLGGTTLAAPAIFGDCGDASPERVTVVDLDSYDESLGFPFTTWVEFCLTSDPDCEASPDTRAG